MKILQVNCVYNNGSTGKITHDLHNALQEKGIESIVCYGRGKKIKSPNIYKTSSEFLGKFNNIKSRLTGMQYNGCWIATENLISIIKKEKPNVVHLQCINGHFVNIYKIIDFLKRENISTVLTLHAEFMYTGNCGHSYECEKWKNSCENCPQLREATNSIFFDKTNLAWTKMKYAFENFENLRIVSVSPWLEQRAKQSAILNNKIHSTILNGIDTLNIFKPQKYTQLKKQYNLKDEKIILHVTANFTSEIKGGKYIIELGKKLKNKNVKIIIIGNRDKNIKLSDNIIDVGRIEDQTELASFYSMADLTVITSKKETFSMVCAESLACGTPVVGFKAGAPEQISINEFSEFVEYGDLEALEKTIKEWLDKSVCKKEISAKAQKVYSKQNMCFQYMKVYDEFKNFKRIGN